MIIEIGLTPKKWQLILDLAKEHGWAPASDPVLDRNGTWSLDDDDSKRLATALEKCHETIAGVISLCRQDALTVLPPLEVPSPRKENP
jgi:hypothetical protein